MFEKFFDNIISQNYSFGDYEHKKYDCELARLASQMENADVRGIMDFWERKAKEDYFELAHPIYNHITLRAVKSFGSGNDVLNIIFMCDKSMQFPLFLLQFSDCFNSFFYQENDQCKALRLDGWRGDYRDHFAMLRAALLARKDEDFSYKESQFGFTLSNCRPYHFFYFALMYFESLNIYNKKVAKRNLYFYTHKIKEYLAKNNEEIVCLQPYVRENGILPFTQYAEESLRECFENNILHQALASKELLIGGGGQKKCIA